jgi:hypothetical protein
METTRPDASGMVRQAGCVGARLVLARLGRNGIARTGAEGRGTPGRKGVSRQVLPRQGRLGRQGAASPVGVSPVPAGESCRVASSCGGVCHGSAWQERHRKSRRFQSPQGRFGSRFGHGSAGWARHVLLWRVAARRGRRVWAGEARRALAGLRLAGVASHVQAVPGMFGFGQSCQANSSGTPHPGRPFSLGGVIDGRRICRNI